MKLTRKNFFTSLIGMLGIASVSAEAKPSKTQLVTSGLWMNGSFPQSGGTNVGERIVAVDGVIMNKDGHITGFVINSPGTGYKNHLVK